MADTPTPSVAEKVDLTQVQRKSYIRDTACQACGLLYSYTRDASCGPSTGAKVLYYVFFAVTLLIIACVFFYVYVATDGVENSYAHDSTYRETCQNASTYRNGSVRCNVHLMDPNGVNQGMYFHVNTITIILGLTALGLGCVGFYIFWRKLDRLTD